MDPGPLDIERAISIAVGTTIPHRVSPATRRILDLANLLVAVGVVDLKDGEDLVPVAASILDGAVGMVEDSLGDPAPLAIGFYARAGDAGGVRLLDLTMGERGGFSVSVGLAFEDDGRACPEAAGG